MATSGGTQVHYATLGNTGLVVSRLSFGTMLFGSGSFMGMKYTIEEKAAHALVARAIEAGINLFDTADGYNEGRSEEILGRALKGRRHEVVVATKCGFRPSPVVTNAGLSRRHVIEACEASLKRLGTDWIDLYQIHKIDAVTPLEETARALEDLVRRGLVRYVGFSNWQAWQGATALGIQERLGWTRFASAQMYYSLVGRDLEQEFVPFARSAGVGILVWSPLAGGFLSGKYTRQDPTGGGGRLKDFDFIPIDKERGYGVVDVLKQVGERRGAKPAQVALAWLLAKPGVTSVILGFSNEKQFGENLATLDVKLTAEDVAALDKASQPGPHYPGWFQAMTVDQVVEKALGRA
jgi:aryl-alcohol dehydrogenase-like predicted oxidoreductase